MSAHPPTPDIAPLRIAVLHFAHETVTFLAQDTELNDFIYEGSPCRDEALLQADPRGYMGGFVRCAREYAGIELVGIDSPLFPKTGIGSGWVTQEAYEHFTQAMLRDLADRGPFDGVYMALHGAMAVRGVPRPEAELAARVRRVVGPNAILGATFDPHGNEDEQFLEAADFAFCVKFYPHYDMHLQGERAARAMVRAMRGDFSPTSTTLKVPIVSPTVLQWTGASPWMDLAQQALVWEAREPDTVVNIYFGFPWSDVPDIGMTVQVTTNGDAALSARIAADLARSAWRMRKALLHTTKIHTIDEGIEKARQDMAAGRTPVVLADHSDRSGSATWVLDAVLRHDLHRTLVASVADKALVSRLMREGIRPGASFDHLVGGLVDESAGQPVRVTGTVLGTGSAQDGTGGRSDYVSVRFGAGNVLVISTYLMQIIDPAMFTGMGLDAADFDLFAIKSRVHFRRGFDDTGFAASILLVEPPEPYLGTVRLDGLRYANVRLEDYYPYGDPTFEV
ncbi:M81 family metallopeptidase [Acidovorax cavernicola]|uniref:M81 family peptidase n=1 Tax=Acidovorax cavernicola TaxID=1675792 RepID=A0A9X8GXF6_9BURK|nr:M81 family metallopeptidase [Acidovorax cavernicola]RIX84718.1 M81 family peptidase [Acidovorax cavernicola]